MDLKTSIITALICSAGATTVLAVFAALKLKGPARKSYIGLLASVTLYSIGYALELYSTTLSGVIASLRLEYLGIPFISVFWVIMALQYTGYSRNIPRLVFGALFIIPVITLVLHNTNHYHHLFYEHLILDKSGPFPMAAITKGAWYYVEILYTNICIGAGNLLFLWMMLHSAGPLRRQAAAMFTVSLFPWIGNIIYQSGMTPHNIDIVPFTLTATSPFLAVALFRFRMFDVTPVARATVFDELYDPVVVLNQTGLLADFNKAAQRVFNDLNSEAIGREVKTLLPEFPELHEIVAAADQTRREIILGPTESGRSYEAEIIVIESRKGAPIGRLIMFHDITDRLRLTNQLEELAAKDGLTGILNRRRLMELGQEEIDRSRRYARPVSLIIADLDHFKLVNDGYGHQTGDAVLVETARLFQRELRSMDILGRYGGEEFALILPETDSEQAAKTAERLRLRLEAATITGPRGSLSITASFGVCGLDRPGDGDNLDSLFFKADKALYLAKSLGRNRVEVESG